MKRELARWIRLVRLEEAQQALDIRRYDAHDAVLKYAGSTRTVKARSVPMGVDNRRNTMDMTDYMPFDEFGRYDVDVYSLEVPGLIEGYPPVARNDVLRLRIVSVGNGQDDKNYSLRLTPTSPRLPRRWSGSSRGRARCTSRSRR